MAEGSSEQGIWQKIKQAAGSVIRGKVVEPPQPHVDYKATSLEYPRLTQAEAMSLQSLEKKSQEERLNPAEQEQYLNLQKRAVGIKE